MPTADIEAVRDWVGTDVPTDTITATLARPDIASPLHAALTILRRRHADLTGNRPSTWKVHGDVEEGWLATQITEVAARMRRLEVMLGIDDPTQAGPLLSSAPIVTPRGTR